MTIAEAKGKLPIDKIIKKLSALTLDKNSNIRKLIEKGAEILKSDKNLRKSFNENILFKQFNNIQKNSELEDVGRALEKEFQDIIIKSKDKEGIIKSLETHFKKGFIAKWGRNLTFEALKFKIKSNFDKTGLKLPPTMEEWLKPTYKNYKTLWNTGAALFLPGFAALFAVPYSFNAWLTNIQKKSGKIGIMKAMDKIDDEKVFVNNDSNLNVNETPIANDKNTNDNLLSKFKTI